MTEIRVSICVKTCNQRQYIQQCLQSIVDQATHEGVEILVGDDCSDDGTSEIVHNFVNEYPSLIVHLRHSERIGAARNTQELARQAKGVYIATVDGDDYWLPGKLEQQIAFMQQYPDCSAVFTNAITVDNDGKAIGVFNDVGNIQLDLGGLFRHGNFLNNSSVMYRAKFKHDWIAIEGDFLDYQAHLCFVRYGHICQIGAPLVAYRVNASGSMLAEANEAVRALYWKAICSVPTTLLSARDHRYGLADFLRRVIFRSIRMRDRTLAIRWWSSVIRSTDHSKFLIAMLVAADAFRVAVKTLIHSHENVMYRR